MRFCRTNRRNCQSGFSLLEMIAVLAILTVVLGVVFGYLQSIQLRSKAEESRVDMFEQARASLDQVLRDLGQAGYPNATMYAPGALATPPANDARYAAGLFTISQTAVGFEADVDGDGVVDSVRYQLVNTPTNGGSLICPCLERSQAPKANGVAPASQATAFNVAVENVAANGLQFEAFDQNGLAIPLAAPITDPTVLKTIRTIRITLNVFGQDPGPQTGRRPSAGLTGVVRLNN